MAKSSTRILPAALIAIAVALLAWQFWPAKAPQRAPAAAPPPAVAPAPADGDTPAAAAAVPGERKIQPSRGPAYRNPQLADLKQRADRGDSRAACELGVDLLRCVDLTPAEQVLANAEANSRTQMPAEQRAYHERTVDRARQLLAECRNAPQDAWHQGNHYLRQAALAGEPEAMYRYARGDSVLADYSRMATPEFDRWRAEAGNMLQLSFEAGYLPSVFDLMVAYSDNSSPIAGLVPNDPTKARAMRLLVGRLAGKNADPPEARYAALEPAAAALAAQWQRDYFANVKPPLRRLPRIMPGGFATLFSEDSAGPPCSQP